MRVHVGLPDLEKGGPGGPPRPLSARRASELIAERVPGFPVCQSWPEVQAACEEHGVEIGGRVEVRS